MKRPPGRPPLDEKDPSVQITVRLPSKRYDELCALAKRQDMSLPQAVRLLLYGNVFIHREKKP